MKTGLNNVLLPTLFNAVNNIVQIVTPDSGPTILFNIVDNYEQCGSTTLFIPVFINPEQVDHFLDDN